MEFIFFIYGLYGYFFIKHVLVNHTGFFNESVKQVRSTFYEYCDRLYSERIAFYKNLDSAGKAKFIYRVQEFIVSKEWKGFYGFEVESEHRALIAACGVQLTFGLKEYRLEHIKRIFITKEIFHSKLFERDVKGLTMYNAIYLSWEDCKKGMDVADDAYNLCLHEFAHALDMTVKVDGAETDNHYLNFLHSWQEQSDRVFELMNGNDQYHGFLREYAKVNKHEFFAVCVEHFFERSHSFKDHDKALYLTLCNLLNLNPLNTKGNYRLEKSYLEMENDPYTLSVKKSFALKWVAMLVIASYGLIYYFYNYFVFENNFFLAGVITVFLFKVTNRREAAVSREYLLKVTGIYFLSLLPFLYLFLSLAMKSM